MSDHPKIQEQWAPQVGDFFFIKDRLFRSTGIVDVYDGKGYAMLPREANYGWLPRQDQIQKMTQPFRHYDHPSTMATYFGLFCDNKEMYEGIYAKKGYGFISKFSSMEQLWLAFYMQEKHKLIWDGEKWVKHSNQ